MFDHIELSVEAIVAFNLGDEDWEDLIPHAHDGCTRRATVEVERDHFEREPNIDKLCSDQLHNDRFASIRA